MILQQLVALLATVTAVYVTLLAVYLASCVVIGRLNRHAAKIQPSRQTPTAQIRRDQRQSLLSLGVIATMLSSGHWAYVTLGWGLRPLPGIGGAVFSLVVSLVLFDTWFSWLHRLIHSRLLYRRVHRWHHLTVTPVTWSNNSDRLIDNLFLQSYWLVAHLMIPIAPAALFAHKIYDQMGHRPFRVRAWRALELSALAAGRRHPPRSAPPVLPLQLRDAFHLVGPVDGHPPSGLRPRTQGQYLADLGPPHEKSETLCRNWVSKSESNLQGPRSASPAGPVLLDPA